MPASGLEPPSGQVDDRAREALKRASENEELIGQVRASFARIERGEPAIPLSEIRQHLKEARARDGLRPRREGEVSGADG